MVDFRAVFTTFVSYLYLFIYKFLSICEDVIRVVKPYFRVENPRSSTTQTEDLSNLPELRVNTSVEEHFETVKQD